MNTKNNINVKFLSIYVSVRRRNKFTPLQLYIHPNISKNNGDVLLSLAYDTQIPYLIKECNLFLIGEDNNSTFINVYSSAKRNH